MTTGQSSLNGKHIHVFITLAINPIKRVQKNYYGTPGDKAFLTRKCKCGKVQPISYGATESMELEKERLEAKHDR